MSDPARDRRIAAATAYQTLHVPALLQAWAGPVLDAAAAATGDRVLDVACGTGVVARAAAARVGPAKVVGVDLDDGMLAVAIREEQRGAYLQASAAALPFASATFDVVCCQFALMFFPDRTAALGEMHRALRHGGRVALAVWASLERSDVYREEVALLDRVAGRAAGDALRAPFVLGDEDLGQALAHAGFTEVAVRDETRPARFPSVRALVEADLRGWLPVMGVTLPEAVIDRVLRDAEEALAGYVADMGEVVFEACARLVSGVAA